MNVHKRRECFSHTSRLIHISPHVDHSPHRQEEYDAERQADKGQGTSNIGSNAECIIINGDLQHVHTSYAFNG